MFDSAFACAFADCMIPMAVTFGVVFVVMLVVQGWIYFKLVALAKERYGELPGGAVQTGGDLTRHPFMKLDDAFIDPYPGIKTLSDVREEELWKLYQIDKSKQKQLVYPVESKYFNLLSSKFLHSKGFTDQQIAEHKNIAKKISKSWSQDPKRQRVWVEQNESILPSLQSGSRK